MTFAELGRNQRNGHAIDRVVLDVDHRDFGVGRNCLGHLARGYLSRFEECVENSGFAGGPRLGLLELLLGDETVFQKQIRNADHANPLFSPAVDCDLAHGPGFDTPGSENRTIAAIVD